ncbi:hypothetical protein PENSPDRAFT_733865 [Peniophora sp. CONT]|nr:hypothetical protein PENSPDRAFT_733865 [Peniophora sp. CONT]
MLSMLLKLPNELLVLALRPLDSEDLVVCKSVCRVLNNVISTSVFLQYTLTLADYGLYDNELSVKAVGEKLQRAHLFHDALRDIRWIPHFTMRFEGQRLDHPSTPLILRNMTGSGDLSLIHSGSAIRDVPERHWAVVPPPATVFAYTFNVAEDLAILQTMDVPRSRFHLLTMSSGAMHPEAARPFFEGETITLDSTTFGPYLFIHGTDGIHTLWNWKTGDMLTKIRCHYYSVAFLDQDHIALVGMTRTVGMALHVYCLPFTIFDEDASRMQSAHYVFGLPTLTHHHSRHEPTFSSLKRGFSSPPASAAAPAGDFYTDPNEALLIIEYAQLAPPRQYEIFFLLRGLQALLTPEYRGQYTPWETWGPQRAHATPLLRYPPIVGWRNHSTFGLRHIGMYPTQRADGVLVAKMHDYHPRRIALARREAPDVGSCRKVVEGEVVDGSWVEKDRLETHLPYIETEVPLPEELQRHRGSMITLGINDDGLIACTDFVASRPNVVHVYTI